MTGIAVATATPDADATFELQRTLDLVAFEKAVAEARVAVRAAVRRRVHGAADEKERDLVAGAAHGDRVARREVVERSDRGPGGGAHSG